MLDGYLLDTNIVSESRRLRADAGVTAFLALARSEELFISVLTLGEFRKGVEAKRRTDPVAAEQLQLWADTIETEFADRVLPVIRPSRGCGENFRQPARCPRLTL